jgi:hypothetical protein
MMASTISFLRRFLSFCFALSVLAACASELPHAAKTDDLDKFVADSGRAKVFAYVAYEDPSDKPFFEHTFRINIDSGYAGDVTDEQYVDENVLPGLVFVAVDMLDFGGQASNHSVLTTRLKVGETAFVAIKVPRVVAADKDPLGISKTDTTTGMNNIAARMRVCAC